MKYKARIGKPKKPVNLRGGILRGMEQGFNLSRTAANSTAQLHTIVHGCILDCAAAAYSTSQLVDAYYSAQLHTQLHSCILQLHSCILKSTSPYYSTQLHTQLFNCIHFTELCCTNTPHCTVFIKQLVDTNGETTLDASCPVLWSSFKMCCGGDHFVNCMHYATNDLYTLSCFIIKLYI